VRAEVFSALFSLAVALLAVSVVDINTPAFDELRVSAVLAIKRCRFTRLNSGCRTPSVIKGLITVT